MKTFQKTTFIVCGLLLFVAGCGGDGLQKVEGRVTYDGQPVERGTIQFLPADGNGPTAAALIAAGRYEIRIASGQKRVQIEGHRVLSRHHENPNNPASPMVEDVEPIVPAKYNKSTTLRVEIKRGAATCDFTLPR